MSELLDRPVSIGLEKTDFLIVAHLHAVAARRAVIVAYGFEPTALLFLLVATMRHGWLRRTSNRPLESGIARLLERREHAHLSVVDA
jgi:hypothetical protein